LIVYRAFFEPGVYGWPEHACVGRSMVADQVAHVAHLNARDTTLVFVSHAAQTDIERVKARMGWEMPWYTTTDGSMSTSVWTSGTARTRSSETAMGCSALTSSTTGRRGTRDHLELPRLDCARRQEEWEDSPEGYPQTPPYAWWNWHDEPQRTDAEYRR